MKSQQASAPAVENALTRTLTTLAAIAGGASAITGMVFVAGYVAVKQHDESLGIITTTASGSYPRTGMEFFFTSAAALYEFATRASAGKRFAILVIAVVTLVWFALAAGKLTKLWSASGASVRASGRLVLHIGLAVVLFGFLPWYLAPMHRRLESMMFVSPAADSVMLTRNAFGDGAKAKAVQTIYDLLHAPASEPALIAEYGKRVAVPLLAIAILWLLARPPRVHQQPADNAQATFLRSVDRALARPAAILFVVIMLVQLPAAYGVMAMPNRFPCVQVDTGGAAPAAEAPTVQRTARRTPNPPARPIDVNYLLSDLSTDATDVTLFKPGRGGDPYRVQFYPREKVRSITGLACSRESILSLGTTGRGRMPRDSSSVRDTSKIILTGTERHDTVSPRYP